MHMTALSGYKIMDRIATLRNVMDPARNRFFISKNCVHVIEALANYAWMRSAEGENKEKPEHNWASHGADAVGYGVLYFERQKRVLRKPRGF
jgi:hypothetical protein